MEATAILNNLMHQQNPTKKLLNRVYLSCRPIIHSDAAWLQRGVHRAAVKQQVGLRLECIYTARDRNFVFNFTCVAPRLLKSTKPSSRRINLLF
jgi:hypothetical protein